MERKFLALGSVLTFLGVVAGAFGAHVLKKYVDNELLVVFETAVRYHMYHSIALILVSILLKVYGGVRLFANAGWFFLIGIVIFSGSLYILSLTGIKSFGIFTPFGGLSFLCGWTCMVIQALKKEKDAK